jgi:hypothetical protein
MTYSSNYPGARVKVLKGTTKNPIQAWNTTGHALEYKSRALPRHHLLDVFVYFI